MSKVKPSKHDGMGAIPYEGGTSFRVWAPHADGVTVVGTFNNWSSNKNPLANEKNGFWSTDVDDAKPGDEYKFVIFNGDKSFKKK